MYEHFPQRLVEMSPTFSTSVISVKKSFENSLFVNNLRSDFFKEVVLRSCIIFRTQKGKLLIKICYSIIYFSRGAIKHISGKLILDEGFETFLIGS